MSGEDKVLEILIKLKADTADVAKVTGSLKGIEAQAVETAAVVNTLGGREAQLQERALELQRKYGVTAEYAARIAERRLAAEEEASVVARRNADAALAANTAGVAESVERAGTAGIDLSTSLFIGAAAGYQLYQVIAHAADEALRLAEEIDKQIDGLVKAVRQWNELAKAASNFADVVKLGEKMEPVLSALAAKLEEFRNKELAKWQKYYDAIAKIYTRGGTQGPGPYQREQNEATAAQERLLRQGLQAEIQALGIADKAKAAFESLNLKPINEAISEQSALVEAAKAKYAALREELKGLVAGERDEAKTAQAVAVYPKLQEAGRDVLLQTARLGELTAKQTKLGTEADKAGESVKKIDFDKLDPADKLKKLSDELSEIQRKLTLLGITAASPEGMLAQALTLPPESAAAVIKQIELLVKARAAIAGVIEEQAKDHRRDDQKELNALLREQQSLLESIHQKQQLIDANVFLSADAKQGASLANARAEMAALSQQIEDDKAKLAGGTLDPETYARVAAELQKLQFQFDLLGLKTQALQLPLQAELANWVNSFGDSSHQIAAAIEGSIGASLQGVNSLLLSAGDRSRTWQQTLVGVEKQIGNLFLTMLEQMAIQQVAQLLHITTTTTAQTASGAAIAAAHAPAAAATSISSYGVAALVGEVLAIAAIAAIMAALGGFAEGGYTGGRRRKIAGVVHGEEFVFDDETTRLLGREWLEKLRRAALSGDEIPSHPNLGGGTLPELPGGRINAPPTTPETGAPYTPYAPIVPHAIRSSGHAQGRSGPPSIEIGGGDDPIGTIFPPVRTGPGRYERPIPPGFYDEAPVLPRTGLPGDPGYDPDAPSLFGGGTPTYTGPPSITVSAGGPGTWFQAPDGTIYYNGGNVTWVFNQDWQYLSTLGGPDNPFGGATAGGETFHDPFGGATAGGEPGEPAETPDDTSDWGLDIDDLGWPDLGDQTTAPVDPGAAITRGPAGPNFGNWNWTLSSMIASGIRPPGMAQSDYQHLQNAYAIASGLAFANLGTSYHNIHDPSVAAEHPSALLAMLTGSAGRPVDPLAFGGFNALSKLPTRTPRQQRNALNASLELVGHLKEHYTGRHSGGGGMTALHEFLATGLTPSAGTTFTPYGGRAFTALGGISDAGFNRVPGQWHPQHMRFRPKHEGGPIGPLGDHEYLDSLLNLKSGEVPFIGLADEFVQRREAVSHYGIDRMHALNEMRIPIQQLRMHEGGSIGAEVSPQRLNSGQIRQSGSDQPAEPIEVHNFNFFDRDELMRAWVESTAGRKVLNDFAKRNKDRW